MAHEQNHIDTAGGDVIGGDKTGGDKVGRDKVSGDNKPFPQSWNFTLIIVGIMVATWAVVGIKPDVIASIIHNVASFSGPAK